MTISTLFHSGRISQLRLLALPIPIVLKLGTKGHRFALLCACYGALWNIARKSKKTTVLALCFRGISWKLPVTSSTDFALLKELFLDEEYAHPLRKNVRVIFDVGANVGVASIYFTCLYPHATIVALEPDPELFAQLSRNVAPYKNIIVQQYAVSDADGMATFYRHKSSSLSGSLSMRGGDDTASSVETKTIDSACDTLKIDQIDILKFDIEGGELSLFKGIKKHIPTYVLGEVHLDILGEKAESFLKELEIYKSTDNSVISDHRYIYRGEYAGTV